MIVVTSPFSHSTPSQELLHSMSCALGKDHRVSEDLFNANFLRAEDQMTDTTFLDFSMVTFVCSDTDFLFHSDKWKGH